MSSDVWAQMREVEHAAHSATVQRQALQSQLSEIESALGALPESGDAWRLIGNLMVKRDAQTLRAELTEKEQLLRTRVTASAKQEEELRARLATLQESVVKGDA